MVQRNQKTDKKPFIRRNWWGLLCITIFVIGSFRFCTPQKVESSNFGGPVYLGKIDKNSQFIVKDTLDKFRIILGNKNVIYYPKNSAPKNSGQDYKYNIEDDKVIIHGFTPNLSYQEMVNNWGEHVGIETNSKNGITVTLGYDLDPMSLSGKYILDKNTVSGHHFMYGTAILPTIFTVAVFGIYCVGFITIRVISFIKNKRQRNRNEESP